MNKRIPRIPLDGSLDITYRCNNNCRHCWLRLPPNSKIAHQELEFDEIRSIVDQARSMGCQAWSISGGEPMLRQDFPEIFDYITRKSITYSLNTNGTLITTDIARLLSRKGKTMVALYGATAEVYDHIARTSGAFEAAMRGFAYLKEAGAKFVVQIVPMRDNYHQYDQMLALAKSLSPYYRIGAPWLWFSASRSENRNREIARQRLEPKDVLTLDPPNPEVDFQLPTQAPRNLSFSCPSDLTHVDDSVFASCIDSRRDFHIDPYGQMSFCCYIKDPALRFDLRRGTFREAWDEFLPSLAGTVHGGQEFLDNCGSCELRRDCRWCASYAYLEHGRYSAKVEYLCQVAEEIKRFKEDWKLTHLRYYRVGGITIKLVTDFAIEEDTFPEVFEKFRVNDATPDTVTIRHVSSVPAISDIRLGKLIHRKSPWAIFYQPRSWTYVRISEEDEIKEQIGQPSHFSIFSDDYSQASIFVNRDINSKCNLGSLYGFSSDQVILAQLLSYRQGCLLHSSGIIINGQGFLFVGHSEAGKSTMLKMLRGHGEILCDDRNIVRRWPEGFLVHGTWSHGELPDVSPANAPLRAIFYLEQAAGNELIPITDKQDRIGRLLSHVVKPFLTVDWWEKTLELAGKISIEVPAYRLRFDKSGKVVEILKQLD